MNKKCGVCDHFPSFLRTITDAHLKRASKGCEVDVTIAYPMLSLGYVINAVLAWYLFGEMLSMQRIIGITVILIGVWILARS